MEHALPNGWEWATLDELGSWSGGGTPAKGNKDYWQEGTIPWVSPKDMKSLFVSAPQDRITQLATDETVARPIRENSVAFVVRSGILEHTLPIALVTVKAAVNQDMRVLTPHDSINPKWLLYALLGDRERIRSTCQKDGTTVASLDVPKLTRWRIGLPPRPEQDRIVEAVERLLAQVDSASTDISEAVTLSRSFEASVIEAVLSGDSTGLDDETAKALRSAHSVPLAERASIRYGWTAKAEASGNAKMLRITDIQDESVDWTSVPRCEIPANRLEEFRLAAGDIVFARTGATTGKSYLITSDAPEDAAFASYLIRVRPDKELEPQFLWLFFRSSAYWRYIREQSRGIGQPNVNGKILGGLEVPVVPLDVQRAAVKVAETALGAVRASRAEVVGAGRLARFVRSAVFSHALNGRLVEQDDKEGSATDLLAAIRLDAAKNGSTKKGRARSTRGSS